MTSPTAPQLPQYETAIDQQTWAFIKQTDQWYPPDTIDFSMQRQREIYDAMCREFHNGYPVGISAIDDCIASAEHSIPVRRYTVNNQSAAAHVVYFHGGGFVVGGLESHDDVCAEICLTTGLGVTAIDYRLAPEHLHPASFNDSISSVVHEYQRLNIPLILCGDSAGGNLAAAVSHKLRDANPVIPLAGQVLIYPALGGDISKGSYVTHANAPMLTTRDVKFYLSIRTGCKAHADKVQLAPLLDTNFKNLPDTIAFSAQCDPVADDAQAYVASVNAAGGNAIWFNEKGLVHGYLRARHTVDRAKASFKRITDSISQLSRHHQLNPPTQ